MGKGDSTEAGSFLYSPDVLTTYYVLGTTRGIKEWGRQMVTNEHTPESGSEEGLEGDSCRSVDGLLLSKGFSERGGTLVTGGG